MKGGEVDLTAGWNFPSLLQLTLPIILFYNMCLKLMTEHFLKEWLNSINSDPNTMMFALEEALYH